MAHHANVAWTLAALLAATVLAGLMPGIEAAPVGVTEAAATSPRNDAAPAPLKVRFRYFVPAHCFGGDYQLTIDVRGDEVRGGLFTVRSEPVLVVGQPRGWRYALVGADVEEFLADIELAGIWSVLGQDSALPRCDSLVLVTNPPRPPWTPCRTRAQSSRAQARVIDAIYAWWERLQYQAGEMP